MNYEIKMDCCEFFLVKIFCELSRETLPVAKLKESNACQEIITRIELTKKNKIEQTSKQTSFFSFFEIHYEDLSIFPTNSLSNSDLDFSLFIRA